MQSSVKRHGVLLAIFA